MRMRKEKKKVLTFAHLVWSADATSFHTTQKKPRGS